MVDNVNKTLLINNKNYQLIWHHEENNEVYLYLINQNNFEDILFAKLINNNELELIKDRETLSHIIAVMTKQINTYIL